MVKSKPTQDSMSLWWLGAPAHLAAPRKIGQLLLTDGNRKVGLTYSDEWLQHGFALSEDLPLARGVFLPKELDMAAGAIDDARPDRWGERVIRNLYRPDRLSVLEYLYFAGDDRFGALGVSMLADAYQPCANGAMSSLNSLPEMERAIAAVLADQPLDEKWTRLLSPGPSFGGARPKSLIEMEGSQWVVKFSAGEDFDTELVEHATLRLAAQCGIQVVKSRALRLAHGHAVAVKRFDRQGGQRSHVISANTVFRAAGLQQGYPELAQALRRIGRSEIPVIGVAFKGKTEREDLAAILSIECLPGQPVELDRNGNVYFGHEGFLEACKAAIGHEFMPKSMEPKPARNTSAK